MTIFETQEAAHYAAEILNGLVLKELEQIDSKSVYHPYRTTLQQLYDQLTCPVYDQLSNQVFLDKDHYHPQAQLEAQAQAEEQEYLPGTCPRCKQELKLSDGHETPPIYCDNCGIGWDCPDEVDRDYLDADPGEHFMDDDGQPEGYQDIQAEMDAIAWYLRQGCELEDADPDPAYLL